MGRSFTLKHSFSRRAGQAYSASSEGIRRPQVVLIVSEGKERGEAAKPHPPTNIEVEDVTMEEGGEDEGAEGPSFRQLVEWDKGFGDVIQDVNVNVLRGKLDNDEDDFDPNNTETVAIPPRKEWKTIQFKHPRTNQPFTVDSNDMFIGMIRLFVEYKAAEQNIPAPLLEEEVQIPVTLVKSNWKEQEGDEDTESSSTSCCLAAYNACCLRWQGMSPMRPVNLIGTAGLGLVLSCVVCACAYQAEQIAGAGVELLLDVKSIGAIAGLSIPSFLAAFGVEKRPSSRLFKLLRFIALGAVAVPTSFAALVVFTWLVQLGKLTSAFLWLGSALLQVALHRHLFNRSVLCPCFASGGVWADDDEEEDVESRAYGQKHQEGKDDFPHLPSASESHASGLSHAAEEFDEEEGKATETEKRAAAIRKAMQSCWIHLAYMGALCAGAARQVCTPTRILHFFKLCERIFEGLLLLAMIAVQICVAYHNVGNWYEADPPPGQMLSRDTQGSKNHMVCRGMERDGAGRFAVRRPVVILEGMEGFGMVAAMDSMLSRLAQDGVACAYDRAGFGRSHPALGLRSPAIVAAELAYMLVNGSNGAPPMVEIHHVPRPMSPPFVIVGHSIGSVYARQFAVDFPELTAAVVSLDGPPVEFSDTEGGGWGGWWECQRWKR